jgi:CMP-N-acetylneuraminic acid synthetase
MKIIAFIPARQGSKSVKDKNIKIYKNKPLIYHTIKIAKKSKYISRVIVSTDSKKYRNLSLNYGAEVPFLRPKNISTDTSLDYKWINHAVKFLRDKENYLPDVILHLRPTTPNREVTVVDKAIKYFLKNYNRVTSMRSVSLFSQPPQKFLQIKRGFLVGFFNKYLKYDYTNYPRQFYPETYLPNGYIDILKPSFFLKNKNLHGNKILPFITKETLDIDLKKDFDKKNYD